MSHVPAHTLRIVAPPFEPVTLAELKTHTTISHANDDGYLSALLAVATAQVERDAGVALVKQRWEAVYQCFPDIIRLPWPPLLDVVSVKYYDTDNVQQTLDTAEYVVLTHGNAGRVLPAPDKSWPSVQSGRLDTVVVTYDAGYVDVDGGGSPINDAPLPIKQAVMVLAAHLYENREATAPIALAEVPMSYESLVASFSRAAV